MKEKKVNAFTKGKGKGGKDWYRYQGAWNDRPSGVGYQGICWRCGEVGHQQRECPKTIQNVNCDNVECDFFFGAVEVERVEAPPISDFERTFRRIRRGAKFGGCSGECGDRCDLPGYETGNKFAELSVGEKENDDGDDETTVGEGAGKEVEGQEILSELEVTDSEEKGGWSEVKGRRRKIEGRKWRRTREIDLCNVEEGEVKGRISTIKVDFQVAAVKNH